MLVFWSMELAFSSRKILSPFTSRVVSPVWAALAMSIASEGLQPPGTTKILTPSPLQPCLATTSLNLTTALFVKLTILPPCRYLYQRVLMFRLHKFRHNISLAMAAQLFFLCVYYNITLF